MFRVVLDQETKEHVLVAEDGQKILLRDDVWQRLRDAEAIFSEWKTLLQKWSIHSEKAEILKRECPDEGAYRSLRTAIRTFQPEQQA